MKKKTLNKDFSDERADNIQAPLRQSKSAAFCHWLVKRIGQWRIPSCLKQSWLLNFSWIKKSKWKQRFLYKQDYCQQELLVFKSILVHTRNQEEDQFQSPPKNSFFSSWNEYELTKLPLNRIWGGGCSKPPYQKSALRPSKWPPNTPKFHDWGANNPHHLTYIFNTTANRVN